MTSSHTKSKAPALLIVFVVVICLDVFAFFCVPKEFEQSNRWMLIPGGGFVGLVRYYMSDEQEIAK